MSVGLGTLNAVDRLTGRAVEVMATNYDADYILLCTAEAGNEAVIELDRRQMQELTIIIDRFLDK